MVEFLRIDGLDDLLTSLDELPTALRSKALQTGMRRAGNLIRDEARRRVVKSTGYLATQIVVRRMSNKVKRRAGLGVGSEYYTIGVRTGKKVKYADTKRNRRMRRVGKVYEQSGWAYYWRHLEFGTKKMAAKPFLTPAAEARGPEAAQAIINETRAAMDRLLKSRGWK